ncbi:TetR/AcrR family transcriptional regulator [Leucobacter luti]|uniref:TetR/AcrR family transcriptional regulator n=1 Tax=Leucobacter luti TaxID=340320 RepID=UPI0010476441|nr:TetR/AcrR family transcriptional regulator [Leucobacter luti]MCW2288247.1 AcrR family transcriptional regulator [Leucobacter luti]QYM75797.1 TetR/AcrR family transcriptional regulator [Leucobacter luti]TCK45595.1 TetR family transcriptional regulator [Leucobacter luti]
MTAEAASSPPSLRERRQFRTRQELVDAVLVVIAEGGVDAATIDRVSAQSGISRGTVYAHFPGGRDELLRAAYARLGVQLVERTRAAVSAAEGWRARLAAHAREMFDLAADARIGHFFNVSGPTLIVDGEARGIGSGASAVMLQENLAHAQSLGEVSADIDAEVTAILLVGALREAAIRVAAGSESAERAYAAFVRLAAGLAASAEQPR